MWISVCALPGSAVARWWAERRGDFVPVVSPRLREEVFDVLSRTKMRRYGPAETLFAKAEIETSGALLLDPPPLPAPVCRDPDDDHVLALALHAEAGWIVTGDRDLLILDPWEGIRIVTPGDFSG